MKLEELIAEGESFLTRMSRSDFGTYVYGYESKHYKEWATKALMFLQLHYPSNSQTERFALWVNRNYKSDEECEQLIAILKAFLEINPKTSSIDYVETLEGIFERFHICARQLKRRHDGRPTLDIKDEYDVQDLLNVLLRLHFDDVRPEEWTPSYASCCNRMDFLLNDKEIAIEVEMTRSGLKDKELGEQLIIDIAKYKEHPKCKTLYCYVFDPKGNIRNPRGLEKDLSNIQDGMSVKVYVRQR